MTKFQKELMDVPNGELLDMFDGAVTNSCREIDRYCRVTKATTKAIADIRGEILRRMEERV